MPTELFTPKPFRHRWLIKKEIYTVVRWSEFESETWHNHLVTGGSPIKICIILGLNGQAKNY